MNKKKKTARHFLHFFIAIEYVSCDKAYPIIVKRLDRIINGTNTQTNLYIKKWYKVENL